jgi:hypothetical protein
MQPTAAALCALSAATLVAAGAWFQDKEDAPVWVQSDLEALALRIQGEIEGLRGARFLGAVPVKVADRASLLAYMKQRTEEMEPPAKIAADERVAKLLGVIPHDMDLLATTYKLLEDQVAGFYDPPSKTFYLMDSMPKGLAGPILAHELVHALDDQLFNLDGTMEELKDESDALQAFRFVVEGSGTAGGNRWTMEHVNEVNLAGTNEMMAEQQASLAAAPLWLWKPLLGAYMQGAAFLTRGSDVLGSQLKQADPKDIERAFRDRPLSTEQVLHPEKYWDPERRDDPRKARFTLGALPQGWSALREDTLGELGLALVLEQAMPNEPIDMKNPMTILGIQYTNELAAGWDADRVILLGKEGQSWMRLVSVWDTERDAGEFYAGMRAVLPRLEAAANALGGEDARSGVELAYGDQPTEVVLTVWSGIAQRRDQREIEEAVTYSVK